MNTTTPPTLDAFTDWLLQIHGATFDSMGATEGDAHRAHLASFARTNTALQLLNEFKAAHPTSASADSGDSEPPSLFAEVNERRRMICLEAAWEIDALARILPGLVPNVDEEAYSARLVVRSMAGRLLRLSSALMGALCDPPDPAEDLERIVTLNGGQG
jgi:hypothetical protein